MTNNFGITFISLCLFIILQQSALNAADDNTNWLAVDGKKPHYAKVEGKEVVLKGTLIVENYGKPGENYFRPPHNYWLKTDDKKISLSINDAVFPKYDKKLVEVKGKYTKNNFFMVGWIRTTKK